MVAFGRVRPYIDFNRVLKRGETANICMKALADDGPLYTRELTARVMRAKGLDEADKVIAKSIALQIVQTLRVRVHNGKLDKPMIRKGVYLYRCPIACLQKVGQRCSGLLPLSR